MSEWSETYRYGLCQPSELLDLQQFLQRHWKKEHPLAMHRLLMDWQHLDSASGCYNFLLARHRETDDIHAILGFIPASQFDETIQPNRDLWLAIWKVRDGVNASGLGLSLLFELLARYKPRSLGSIGISPIARSIYKMLGYRLGALSHYYMLHPNKSHFRLVSGAIPPARPPSPQKFRGDKVFIRCNAAQFQRLAARQMGFARHLTGRIPFKSPSYWLKRYYEHPVYAYDTFAILSRSDPDALSFITIRQAQHAGACALRIVDYLGDPVLLADTKPCFEGLLGKYDAEYIDFYCFGFQETVMPAAGFKINGSCGGLTVPNYFEPFEQRNVRIDFACKVDKNEDYFITKGDSDQDRPNIIIR